MKLRFKNKLSMAILKSLQEGEKLGGVPKELVLTSQEAGELIRELQALTAEVSDIPTQFVIGDLRSPRTVGADNVVEIGARWSWARPDISKAQLDDMVSVWKTADVMVSFKYRRVENGKAGEARTMMGGRNEILVSLVVEDPEQVVNPPTMVPFRS